MAARILRIENRFRLNPIGWVSLSDFTFREDGFTEIQTVINNPNITLYCLDHSNKQAVFVETPPEVDLLEAPFFFQAQFEHAQRLISIPYESFYQLADHSTSHGEDLILLYSVGRCGSTLLSNVFKQMDSILSLSEPDVFTNILGLRELDGSRDDELEMLIRSSIYALAKPLGRERPSTWVVKFRSYCVELADLIYKVYPQAKIIFMYRNAEDWAKSTTRAFRKLESEWTSVGAKEDRKWAQRAERLKQYATIAWGNNVPQLVQRAIQHVERKAGAMNPEVQQMRLKFYPLLKNYQGRMADGNLSRVEYITLEWLSAMHRYLTLYEQRVPMCALRYEDLVARPQQIVSRLFEYCNLPTNNVDGVCQVFARDSQRGTSLSQTAVRQTTNNELTEEHIDQIRTLLREHPALYTPDVILPGTL